MKNVLFISAMLLLCLASCSAGNSNKELEAKIDSLQSVIDDMNVVPEGNDEMDFTIAQGDINNLKIGNPANGGLSNTFGQYQIQVIQDHGSMVVRARKENSNDWQYLFTESLFSAGDPDDFDGEVFIGQCDLDEDGRDELIVGARNKNGEPAGIGVNIYPLDKNGNFDTRISCLYDEDAIYAYFRKSEQDVLLCYGEAGASQWIPQRGGTWGKFTGPHD